MDFFEILVHRDARARRPRSWCSCARWRARACARASRPQPCMAFLCTVARARASRPQPWMACVGCVSAMCQVCVSQPEIKNPRPARNAKSATSPKSRWDSPPPRHPCCEKWCGAHFFYDASDEKPVSPCVARVIKFHFRRCSIRKACVGDPSYRL